MALTPRAERVEHRFQGTAVRRELILDVEGTAVLHAPVDDAVGLELPELLPEHLRGDPLHRAMQVPEPPSPAPTNAIVG